MPVVRITNGFNELSFAELLVRANVIVGKMQGNPNFMTPEPGLNLVRTAINEFAVAVEAAASGDTQAKAVRDQKAAALIDLLHKLGNYVLFTAQEDAVIATSSGFHIAKTRTPQPPISSPVVTVENGVNSGELKLSTKKVTGAKSYNFQYTADPLTESSVWESVSGTTTKKVISGLKSGNRYWCRIAAVGSKDQITYSNVQPSIVL